MATLGEALSRTRKAQLIRNNRKIAVHLRFWENASHRGETAFIIRNGKREKFETLGGAEWALGALTAAQDWEPIKQLPTFSMTS